jgi:hypothetical protein
MYQDGWTVGQDKIQIMFIQDGAMATAKWPDTTQAGQRSFAAALKERR